MMREPFLGIGPLVFCSLLHLACAHNMNDPANGQDPAGPFALVLERIDPVGLRASLVNRSSEEQAFLHDPYLQPSRLVLTNAKGDTLRAFDTRSIKKYDTTVYRSHYRRLDPDEAIVLLEAPFEPDDAGLYAIRWGPFAYAKLPAGRYTAEVEWNSGIDTWRDRTSGRDGRIESVWMGRIASNRVDVVLP